jgi:hypothetical protein
LEEAGIVTVVVAVAALERPLRAMSLPRVLLTPHLLGRPIGYPGQRHQQGEVIRAALEMLAAVDAPRVVHSSV